MEPIHFYQAPPDPGVEVLALSIASRAKWTVPENAIFDLVFGKNVWQIDLVFGENVWGIDLVFFFKNFLFMQNFSKIFKRGTPLKKISEILNVL